MIIYTLFVLLGQSSATLLGRLYYNEGGNTVLLAALLETIGFPILIPFALYFSSSHQSNNNNKTTTNDCDNDTVYTFLGLFQAGSGVLYAIGLQNLPVSTFSLLNTTQLGFSAFFSFFLNEEKFTFLILNALVLVTISSTLLIYDTGNISGNSESQHFLVGFLCTFTASALYSLTLSMTQVIFQKLLKKETFCTVLNMVIYQSLIASIVVMVALFVSGEWWGLRREMESFEMGKLLYVVVVVMIAVGWQVYSIGAVGLIFEVSSLFSNVISTVGLPVVPILAAVFFHEKMDVNKAMSMFLGVWGFVNYVYQNYLAGKRDYQHGMSM
ncbi:probable purine permease 9 [Phtheirospermum japonicum]|uniref:Probable purine permease n=1 Tax=Phtheirospermum japonicum TaxID=374723 RepID=A0A830C9L9_9LAMI|nr:probable purine permease 9 [Phtheirospermum japonicum]